MATGYTQVELDALLLIMEDVVPSVPSKRDKKDAPRVTGMRLSGTDKGILANFETTGGRQEIYWLNCWVAKEVAAAVSHASNSYGWPKRGLAREDNKHIRQPKRVHLATAIGVNSLSTSAEFTGMLVRFAVQHRIRSVTLFLPAAKALEAMLAIVQAGQKAEWWDDDFELIPSRESQH